MEPVPFLESQPFPAVSAQPGILPGGWNKTDDRTPELQVRSRRSLASTPISRLSHVVRKTVAGSRSQGRRSPAGVFAQTGFPQRSYDLGALSGTSRNSTVSMDRD